MGPRLAVKLRRGGMLALELEELQYIPLDKHAFLKTLHNVFFPLMVQEKDQPPCRFHRIDVSPAAVKAAAA